MKRLVQLIIGVRRVARDPRDIDPDLAHMDRRRLGLIDDLNALKVERDLAEWPATDRRHGLFGRRVGDRFKRR